MFFTSKNTRLIIGITALMLAFKPAWMSAEVFLLENEEDSVVGEIQHTWAESSDTLLDIARHHGLGFHEIKRVNPGIDTWLPETDQQIILPSRYVLPRAKRRGLVLNIPEMRLYFFPSEKIDGKSQVITYPLGVGRQGWQTPYIDTRIIQKTKDPYWHPPKSIREEHEEAGDPLPKRVPPGPDNPLGNYAMRLGLPDYLIHGTNKPYGIGMRVSHGCIRLYPEDIEELFPMVKVKTPVKIVNQPYKVGIRDNKIWLEAHPFLEEDSDQFQDNLTSVVKMIVDLTDEENYRIEWDLAKRIIREMKGIPIVIGRLKSSQMQAATSAEAASLNDGISLQLETGITR